jgi:hypothetical protein
MINKKMLTVAMGCMAISTTAQAACWTPAEADAATVRELQSRMMVAALRCSNSNHDVLNEYNRFVGSKKPLLKMGNNVLRSHFAKGLDRKQAMKAYDKFAVTLANKYGAGSGDLSECKSMHYLARTSANSEDNHRALVSIANRYGISPKLPGGRCGIVIASRD